MQNCPLVTCGESLRRIEYTFPEDVTPGNVRFVVLHSATGEGPVQESLAAELINGRTYRFPYTVPLDAQPGLYTLMVLSRTGNSGVFMDELFFSVQQPTEECLVADGGVRIEISNHMSQGFTWMLGFDKDDQASIQKAIKKGHTSHCARRQTWGDGECECGKAGPNVKVTRIDPNIPMPKKATPGSSGYDLQAWLGRDVIVIPPGGRALIPTGLHIEMGLGIEAQIRSRSGLAIKHGVAVLNSPGTIDSDYRGEIQVILINHGEEPFDVKHGMRIAQMVFVEVRPTTLQLADALQDSVRGAGGFGHTGV